MIPEKIKKACENAGGHHTCLYADDFGKPVCVIACLGVLHGILCESWTEQQTCFEGENASLSNSLPYPKASLVELQTCWDNGLNDSKNPNEDLLTFARTLEW